MEHKDCGDEQPAKRQRVGEDCADAMVTEESAHICAKRAAPATSQPACLTSRDKILAVERDYTHFYLLDVMDEPGADQFVYKHFNSLSVVGLKAIGTAFGYSQEATWLSVRERWQQPPCIELSFDSAASAHLRFGWGPT